MALSTTTWHLLLPFLTTIAFTWRPQYSGYERWSDEAGLCHACRAGEPPFLHSQLQVRDAPTRPACPRCLEFHRNLVDFRLAQYWLVSRSQERQRELVREGARVATQLFGIPPGTKPPAVAHAVEDAMFRRLQQLIATVPVTTIPGVPGWAFVDPDRVQQLLQVINGFLPHVPGVERLSSDGFGLLHSVAVGPEAPSSSAHLIALSFAGNQYLFSILPLAFGARHTSHAAVAKSFAALKLPKPARLRVYLGDQGDLNALAEEYTTCLFCNCSICSDVRRNDVRTLVTEDPPMSLSDWPTLRSRVEHLGITSLDQIIIGPLHWLALAVTAFLKCHWSQVGDWIRSNVPECSNLNLDPDAAPVVAGQRQQIKGISIRQLTNLLHHPQAHELFSTQTLHATTASGARRETSDRQTFEALRALRQGESLKWERVVELQQRVVDAFFVEEHADRSQLWTKGLHAGLHIGRALRVHDLQLGDLYEQSMEHLNQAADVLAGQYNGIGVRIAAGLCTTGLLLEAGAATVVRPPTRFRVPRRAGAGGGAHGAAAAGAGAGAADAGSEATDDGHDGHAWRPRDRLVVIPRPLPLGPR